MASSLGILAFIVALVALFMASEVLRRSSARLSALENTVLTLATRLQKIEGNVYHVDKLAAEIRHQRRRQADTLTALANKGEGVPPTSARSAGEDAPQFTPSTHLAENAVVKAHHREAERAATQKSQKRRSA